MLTGVEHQLATPRSGSQAQRMDQRRRFDDRAGCGFCLSSLGVTINKQVDDDEYWPWYQPWSMVGMIVIVRFMIIHSYF